MAKFSPHVMLKPKREAAIKRKHPWIFSRAIAHVEGQPQPGALIGVYGANHEFLAWGHYSPHSQIRVRLIAWDPDPIPDTRDFWHARLQQALATRAVYFPAADNTNAYRLVNAESDGLPGLIVDRYNETFVVQLLTVGMDARRDLFTELLVDLLHPHVLYERSDVDARQREGLKEHTGILHGAAPPARIEIHENGVRFLVDIYEGHKSGFYLDQRENRQRVRETVMRLTHIQPEISLLNVFAYTGGFALYALAGGATTIVNVDTSADALQMGQANLALNNLSNAAVEDIVGDAFHVLRDLREAKRTFDIVVLDPPKFAFKKRDVRRAARGYKDINMQAIHLLKPGGHLFTFSCSGAVSADLFQKIVFGAALDTGREVHIIGKLTQGQDHPIALTFPEGEYLKGLLCRVIR